MRNRATRSPRVKKLRVSDINMPRYEQEFKEICPLSCGSFGTVVAARHILDGVVYAIKVCLSDIEELLIDLYSNSFFTVDKYSSY